MKTYPKIPCNVCGKDFQMRCANQRVCDHCRPEYKRMDNILRLRGYREKKGVTPVGSTLKCSDCGGPFVFKSANQHRCKDCQKKFNTRQIHRWLTNNDILLKKYRKEAKENYYYSGNRIPAHERDGHKCVKCGSGDNLHLHHIDGRGKGLSKAERNDALTNLATLCMTCHRRLHVITEKALYAKHTDTVLAVFKGFLHSH